MRLILDTNVLVSGIFFAGPPSLILKAWRGGIVSLVMTAAIFEEYRDVLLRLSAKYPAIVVGPLIDLIAIEAELIKAPRLRKRIADDPDDDKFFACARAGRIEFIVSGDQHLLSKSGSLGVSVLKPAEFVRRYLRP